jgi:hypothetical protein
MPHSSSQTPMEHPWDLPYEVNRTRGYAQTTSWAGDLLLHELGSCKRRFCRSVFCTRLTLRWCVSAPCSQNQRMEGTIQASKMEWMSSVILLRNCLTPIVHGHTRGQTCSSTIVGGGGCALTRTVIFHSQATNRPPSQESCACSKNCLAANL